MKELIERLQHIKELLAVDRTLKARVELNVLITELIAMDSVPADMFKELG